MFTCSSMAVSVRVEVVGSASRILRAIILELLNNWSVPSWWVLIKPQSHGMRHNLW